MNKTSAGILAFRTHDGITKVLLVHPGGPFFLKKDLGAWSVPKGEVDEGEDMLAAAKREFSEETGASIDGIFTPLTPIKQKNGKTVHAWAVAVSQDISFVSSNLFSLEWPPRSGKFREFPEVDKAEWFTSDEARIKINPAQIPFLEEIFLKGR
jgi:predicted NUDIX family NTP pyrophosphohydrolase